MKSQTSFAASLLRAFVGLVFVTMTIVFLTVPYALSRHPGDPSPQLTTAESRHLS